MSAINIVVGKIDKIIERIGYVTEDQILDFASVYALSLTELDSISEKIISKGIVVLDEGEEEEENLEHSGAYDWSQTDYKQVYEEILTTEPRLHRLISDISKIKPPQRREFDNLIMHAQEGNEFARTRIIQMYLRTAVKQALLFSKRYKTNLEETIQEAFTGLVTALNQYEIGKNGAFLSYATLWMLQIMQSELPPNDTPFYFPMYIKEHYFRLVKILEKEGISENSFKSIVNRKIKLMEALEIDEEKFGYILRIIHPLEEFGVSHEEILSAQNCYNQNFLIEDTIHRTELRNMLQKLSNNFPEREKDILALRYGFGNNKVHTLQEIADIYEFSRERARQVEIKALRRFRHPKRVRILKDFYC